MDYQKMNIMDVDCDIESCDVCGVFVMMSEEFNEFCPDCYISIKEMVDNQNFVKEKFSA